MYGKRIIAASLLLLAVGCTKGVRNDATNSRSGEVIVEEIENKPQGMSLRARVGNSIVKKKIWRILQRGPEDNDKDRLIVRICQNAGGCAEKKFR